MCEPTHSIVQYPSQDSGEPDKDIGASNESRLSIGLGPMGSWLKKVDSFFHLSKLGSGHSESIEWAGTKGLWLPRDTKFEAKWWNRKVHFDGWFEGKEFLKEQALEAAKGYAYLVSIGSLSLLRRFLEVSLNKTETPYGYISVFLDQFLNKGAKDKVYSKLKVAGLDKIPKSGYKATISYQDLKSKLGEEAAKIKLPIPSVVGVLLGATRHREFLNPEWADDNSLWEKGEKVLS